jgi:hypothetical protein
MKRKTRLGSKPMRIEDRVSGPPERVPTNTNQKPIFTEYADRTVVSDKDFTNQLKAFKKEDFTKGWEGCTLKGKVYHTRIFVLSTGSDSQIEIVDIDGKTRKASDSILGRQFTHIGKIIRIGDGFTEEAVSKYEVGNLVLLNKTATTGMTINPDFAISQRAQQQFGYSFTDTKDVPRSIENIQIAYADHILCKPTDYLRPLHLMYDFGLPDHRIVETYDI